MIDMLDHLSVFSSGACRSKLLLLADAAMLDRVIKPVPVKDRAESESCSAAATNNNQMDHEPEKYEIGDKFPKKLFRWRRIFILVILN